MQTVVPLSSRPAPSSASRPVRLRSPTRDYGLHRLGRRSLAALACASADLPKKHAAVSIAGSPSTIRRPVARLPNSQWMECSATADGTSGSNWYKTRSVSLEAGASLANPPALRRLRVLSNTSSTRSATDLNAALRVIAERARSLLRGSGAAIALVDRGPMMCRASVGKGGPPLGHPGRCERRIHRRMYPQRQSPAL